MGKDSKKPLEYSVRMTFTGQFAHMVDKAANYFHCKTKSDAAKTALTTLVIAAIRQKDMSDIMIQLGVSRDSWIEEGYEDKKFRVQFKVKGYLAEIIDQLLEDRLFAMSSKRKTRDAIAFELLRNALQAGLEQTHEHASFQAHLRSLYGIT